jgi:hypothetical protein
VALRQLCGFGAAARFALSHVCVRMRANRREFLRCVRMVAHARGQLRRCLRRRSALVSSESRYASMYYAAPSMSFFNALNASRASATSG